MKLTTEALQAFRDHVLYEYPKEACGVIVNSGYKRCSNAAEDPRANFHISAVELLQCSQYGRIEAVLHSHPYRPGDKPDGNPEWPSANDMSGWMASGIPWGIVATDGQGCSDVLWLDDSNRAPLVGRPFIHGVQDCYSIIRDYYHQQGIELPNYPRQWDWWHKGDDLYSSNFTSAGFVPIKRSESRPGDCILYRIVSPVINHAAVITGPDTILHHLTRRSSCYDSRSKWARFEAHTVRYSP